MKAPMVIFIVVGNVVLGVGTLVWVVQRTERSRFRYRIWRVRDRVVAALLAEDVEAHPAIRQWLDRAEVLIAATRYLTPFQFISASRMMRRAGWTPEGRKLFESAPHDVQELLHEASTDARKAYARLFVLGSPSGWLLLLVAVISSPWLLWRQRRHHKKCDEPPLDSVAKWSNKRYGSPADVFRPLVQRPQNKRRTREAAYV